MSNETRPDWFTLSAYFAGECTAEERTTVERWMATGPERQRLVQQLQALWEARQQPPYRDYNREAAVAHVMAAIQRRADATPRRLTPRRTLPQVVRSLLDGMASRAMAALFGPRDTVLSADEVERLWKLIDRAEAEDQ